jgi:RNA polymerase sigma-70 factor (ECF subfamily)
MTWVDHEAARGLDDLRAAVLDVLGLRPRPAGVPDWVLLSEARVDQGGPGPAYDDSGRAASSEESAAERTRLIALVDLARDGDSEAFGQLYDHYQGPVYRFVYYRTRSQALAEDLTSETFLRALRRIDSFTWQGKDIGAWFVTIARNLVTDHMKSSRFRLEVSTADMLDADRGDDGIEEEVIGRLQNAVLLDAVRRLKPEQQECIVLRFLQGLSVAETSAVMRRSEGAVKQLQLRAVRALAKLIPEPAR